MKYTDGGFLARLTDVLLHQYDDDSLEARYAWLEQAWDSAGRPADATGGREGTTASAYAVEASGGFPPASGYAVLRFKCHLGGNPVYEFTHPGRVDLLQVSSSNPTEQTAFGGVYQLASLLMFDPAGPSMVSVEAVYFFEPNGREAEAGEVLEALLVGEAADGRKVYCRRVIPEATDWGYTSYGVPGVVSTTDQYLGAGYKAVDTLRLPGAAGTAGSDYVQFAGNIQGGVPFWQASIYDGTTLRGVFTHGHVNPGASNYSYFSLSNQETGTSTFVVNAGPGATSLSLASADGNIGMVVASVGNIYFKVNSDLGLTTSLGGVTVTGGIITARAWTKGDILAAAGSTTLNKLAVGSDGQVLTADAASTNGVKWATGSSGSGTVTSVAASGPSSFMTWSSAVTTSGTLTATLATQSANVVFAGPTSGGAATPAFRALVTADLAASMVTYAKIQDVSATARLLGRRTSGSGVVEECTISQTLDFVSSNQGDILYRENPNWLALPAGTKGYFLKTGGASANPAWDNAMPAGARMAWYSATAPTGWLPCDGAAVSRTTYADLFAAIGTTFGSGNGTTTFNVPDDRDLFYVGSGTSYTVNTTGGVSTVTLGTSQIPAHTHAQQSDTLLNSGGGSVAGPGAVNASTGGTTGSTGGGGSHTNLPPYRAVLWIIKT